MEKGREVERGARRWRRVEKLKEELGGELFTNVKNDVSQSGTRQNFSFQHT